MSNPSTNIFNSDDFSQSEDLVLIIENSPAFYSSDFTPNRFLKFIELMTEFVEERVKIDYRDRAFLIVFGDKVLTPMNDYDVFTQNLLSLLHSSFDQIESHINIDVQTWALNFQKALQIGIQRCIFTFKQIRNKTLRLLIVVNQLPSGLPETYNASLRDTVERTAQRLDIIIDVIHITGAKTASLFDIDNSYKILCDMTGGVYYQIQTANQMEEAFKELVKKKKILLKSYVSNREYTTEKQFLEVIASELEPITDILGDADLKCQICFKKDCVCDVLDHYQHLRRCPNCEKIIHNCCSGKWAEQQNSKSNFIGFPNVFRCPYCFYLLKVPREFVDFDRILFSLQEKWLRQKEKEDEEQRFQTAKQKELRQFVDHMGTQQDEKQILVDWLTPRLPEKSSLDIGRIADDIIAITDKEEKEDFVNYLKFKEGIDDNSMPF